MVHPRLEPLESTPPAGSAESAAALGYRMPAEWEPQSCVWVTDPHNPETWPTCLDAARKQFEAWLDAMSRFVPVCSTQSMGIATNDSWIRDYGPIFVVRDAPPATPAAPPLAAHDFHFNGWGGKYEDRDLDDVVPQHIARALNLPLWVHDLVLEGGSIDVNGRGAVLTTEQCLLNANRNPQLTRVQIEAALHETLGTRHVIWLPGGIEGDDTDGHIDDVARFVTADTVVASRAPHEHPDYEMLERNWQALGRARDQDGQPLALIELPVPEPIVFDYPADRFGPGGRAPVPASHANFLITNGAVFVPVFGQRSDEPALRALEQALPGRSIVPVRSEWLVVGLGALHCLSQQQPVPAAACDA
ncbi:MAG: agmatine deiminase family protein [Phycisphaeraceae bacterium]